MKSNLRNIVKDELNSRKGILNLIPCWVARRNLTPGKRLKINPRDLYACGAERGSFYERWIASVAKADNGVLSAENEGLSYVNIKFGERRILLKEIMDEVGDLIIGEEPMNLYGGLTSYTKFFDYACPIAHHVHLMEKDARVVGVSSKPEAYFFPPQLNAINYNHNYTFFGLLPNVTREDVIKALKNWGKYGDNGILELSAAYKLKLGTGWNLPPGIIHAPGSLVTYEPQKVNDSSMIMQSMVFDKYFGPERLTKFVPPDKRMDFEYMVDMLDWEANKDPNFKANYYCEPIPVKDADIMKEEGYLEEWICYGSDEFCAKSLTVFPGHEVTIKDSAAYGLIMLEGYGTINGNKIETPSMINYGKLTSDEMYVSKEAANSGVKIKNWSDTDLLVMYKNFCSDNPESKVFVKNKGSDCNE
jgi:hypothetical protein